MLTRAEIQALILATPAAMALLDAVRSDPAPVPDTVAIAEAISAGRTRTESRLIGDGEVSLALGVPAGPLFVMSLEDAASDASRPGPGAASEEIELFATARQAWRSLQKGAFDIGDSSVRAAIDLFVGALLNANQAASLKALSPEIPDPVPEFDVRCAILADDGSLLV